MDDSAFDTETDLQTQSILLAAAHHDTASLRNLLRNSSANVQDAETGFTPLHAAIAACEPDDEDSTAKASGDRHGATNGTVQDPQQEMEAAVQTMKLLFENGAIWNDLDANGETPGCIAHRLGLKELYELCVDAGVRAELLLSRMAEYQLLGDVESDEEDAQDEEDEQGDGEVEELAQDIKVLDMTQEDARGDESTKNPNYLSSHLTFNRDRLVDDAGNGVMMAWERTLMQRSAELLLPATGLRVLNVGHGMGIIDGIFQDKQPKAHHIIEAHPDVVQRMKEQGWDKKQGVVIHEGTWQHVVPELVQQGLLFDAIYFDTFAEEYSALRQFFSEYVIGLLDPAASPGGTSGKFGFFCGMGADRQVVYDVYSKIVEMDLFEAGFDTEWETIPVPDLDEQGEWEGLRRKYWVLKDYKLPTCSFIG